MGSRAEQLAALLTDARNEQERVYDMFSEAERIANGTWETWAPKDFLGHFSFWQNNSLEMLNQLDQPPPTDQESFEVRNERNYRNYETRPYAEVYADYRASLDQIIARVKTFSDDELADPQRYPRLTQRSLQIVLLGNIHGHMLTHLAELYRKLGDDARGFEIQERGAAQAIEFDPSPRNQGLVYYNLACAYALAGRSARALELLSQAFPLREDLREFAVQDTDLDSLRELPEYKALMN